MKHEESETSKKKVWYEGKEIIGGKERKKECNERKNGKWGQKKWKVRKERLGSKGIRK